MLLRGAPEARLSRPLRDRITRTGVISCRYRALFLDKYTNQGLWCQFTEIEK